MASNTERFGLLKKDPIADGNDTFNIQTMLNDNWDKLDEAAKKSELDEHTGDTTVHITATDRDNWNAKETPAGAQEKASTAEANAKAYTDQQLSAHSADTTTGAHKAKNITVEDVNNHFAGTDVESVLNELFTFANDGKTAVANAITAKGVSASPSDTFATLATKIGQISTGRKVTNGTVLIGNSSPYPVEIHGLSFQPFRVIWYASKSNGYWCFFDSDFSRSEYMTSATTKSLAQPMIVYSDGFRCDTNDDFLYGRYATWIAIG